MLFAGQNYTQTICTPQSGCHIVQVPVRASRPVKLPASGQVHPGPQEEKEAAHQAFMHAVEASKPKYAKIPGLQQFAASVWERRRRIPSTTYNDPLDHVFTEFDEDNDGHLTAKEVAHALQSRGVEITVDQVQAMIDVIDLNKNGTVERGEFPELIFKMAAVELKSVSSMD
eukprot:GHRR01000339.1.p1 GENE.GHRR01000339.1~~GHRR01000339.1.p1  ORF type:complete len:171 (+),score=30.08 GHRR01000339.1:229-741(+)